MRRIFLFLLGSLFVSFLTAQNFVLNPGFESFSSCPSFGQFTGFVNDWVKPTVSSSDYLNQTCPSGMPAGQSPHTGDAVAGIITYDLSEYREYITGTFCTSLQAGTTYRVEYWVLLHDNYVRAISEMGAYLSMFMPTPSSPNPSWSLSVTPQIESSTPLTNKLNWTLVSGLYTAVGGEQFITIGNFRNNSNTTITNAGSSGSLSAYYFIDDVSVSPILPILDLGPDTVLCQAENYLLDATTASASNYIWSDTTTSPTNLVDSSGLYWVEVSVGSCVFTDTVDISFTGNFGVNLGPDTTLCNGDSLLLDVSVNGGSYQWSSGDTTATNMISNAGPVSVAVTDSNNCTVHDTLEVATANTPIANFACDSLAASTVQFSDSSTGTPATWSWDFGDGNNSASQHPQHTYVALGTFVVKLIVTNICGSDTLSKSIAIDKLTAIYLSQNIGVNVFPNPAKERLYIETNAAEISKVEFVSLMGKRFRLEEMERNNGRIKLNVGSLNPGIYLLNIFTTQGSFVRKIRVQY